MGSSGHVIGGHYKDAVIQSVIGSTLVVQAGLKWRKLNADQIAEWEEVLPDGSRGTVSAVGQAVVGAVLPRLVNKTASAAVGAALDATMRPPRVVRVSWADGKQSLIKLPENLFTHFALMVESRQVQPAAATVEQAAASGADTTAPGMAEQAFGVVTGLLKDRFATPGDPVAVPEAVDQPDITEQITKLADLRAAGILTEEEFVAKKTELLSRI